MVLMVAGSTFESWKLIIWPSLSAAPLILLSLATRRFMLASLSMRLPSAPLPVKRLSPSPTAPKAMLVASPPYCHSLPNLDSGTLDSRISYVTCVCASPTLATVAGSVSAAESFMIDSASFSVSASVEYDGKSTGFCTTTSSAGDGASTVFTSAALSCCFLLSIAATISGKGLAAIFFLPAYGFTLSPPDLPNARETFELLKMFKSTPSGASPFATSSSAFAV
jgi:hypothetical protein